MRTERQSAIRLLQLLMVASLAFPAALAQALAANRPAVIDVVTDIDALAPVAVS